MSVAAGQQRTFLRLIGALRPHWHRDQALPARIQGLFARHKEFGSRDRRLYRELIYTTLRYLPWIELNLDNDPDRAAKTAAWLAADNPTTARYRADLCADWPIATTLSDKAAFLETKATDLLPRWFIDECPALFASPELDAQLARAPLWLRLQASEVCLIENEFAAKHWRWKPSAVLQSAWHVLDEVDVTRTECFSHGAFEVQDIGSQFIVESVGVEPGGRWLDACAGAGGKTLQLARRLGDSGQVDAHDIRPDALNELATRAIRAGGNRVAASGENAGVIRGIPESATIRLLKPAARSEVGENAGSDFSPSYDGVLVDAPCSGSGTWRRAPHLKWSTTPEVISGRAQLQRQLLSHYSGMVRPGGRLVYATCSLARSENEAVVADFVARHHDFEPTAPVRTFGFSAEAGQLTILPSRHDSDGFFVASFRRKSR